MLVKNNITNERQNKYVVIRNGLRVSELEYLNEEDAKVEYDHWKNIVKRWPDGSKLEIIESKGK
jgi:hydrogenase maturation factor